MVRILNNFTSKLCKEHHSEEQPESVAIAVMEKWDRRLNGDNQF
jgi:hypothetical protein